MELGVHAWAWRLLGQLRGAAGTKLRSEQLRPQTRCLLIWRLEAQDGGAAGLVPLQLKERSAPALLLGVWTLSHPPSSGRLPSVPPMARFPLPAAAAKSLQSCPTLSDPMDCSPPGSSIHGIFQARVLEWGAIAFSFPFLGVTLDEAPHQ